MDLTGWITDNGINDQMLTILLFIPVIATIINFTRYVVGFKTLGIYAPLVLSFAYIFTGIRFGILITIAVVLASLISYSLLKKIRMNYLSRVTINYIVITAVVIAIITLNETLPFSFTTSKHDPTTIPPLGVILIATLSDFFIKHYVKNSLFASLRSVAETVLIAVIGWSLLRVNASREFVYNNLWLQPALLAINYGLGKYSGLRLKELSRFKQVAQND